MEPLWDLGGAAVARTLHLPCAHLARTSRAPCAHLAPTLRAPGAHLARTSRTPCAHLARTLRPPCAHLVRTLRAPRGHLARTLRPPCAHFARTWQKTGSMQPKTRLCLPTIGGSAAYYGRQTRNPKELILGHAPASACGHRQRCLWPQADAGASAAGRRPKDPQKMAECRPRRRVRRKRIRQHATKNPQKCAECRPRRRVRRKKIQQYATKKSSEIAEWHSPPPCPPPLESCGPRADPTPRGPRRGGTSGVVEYPRTLQN